MEHSKAEILEVLDQYIHNRKDREIMAKILTDRPSSLEEVAYECNVSLSTVRRAMERSAFVYKYLP